MERMIARIIDEKPAYELAIMTMMIYSLPRELEDIDSLVVFPGMGEDWRVIEAVKIWNKHKNIKTLLIGGVHKGEVTYNHITIDTLRSLRVPPQREEGIIFQSDANQTNQQTDWVVKQAMAHDITNIGLLISPYHLLRAYCTLIRSFRNLNSSYVQVVPLPVPVAPDILIPETGVDAWHMAMGEYERIEAYQQKGDVATYCEAREYLTWLWGRLSMDNHR